MKQSQSSVISDRWSFPSVCIRVQLWLALALFAGIGTANAAEPYEQNVVRVAVTTQAYDFFRPWQKRQPATNRGMGVVLEGNRVLVVARLVGNATFVELERISTGEKATAKVEAVDYHANLAVLNSDDAAFMAALTPVKVSTPLKLEQDLEACQFEANGTAIVTDGKLKSVDVEPYPRRSAFLVYKAKVTLSQDAGSYTIPFFRRKRLVGMLLSNNASTNTATLLPAPVIEHFLKDLDDGNYDGFPSLGMGYTPIEDPQLRRYLKMSDTDTGVYISQVVPGAPADKAGLKVGDVLRAIDKFNVDKHGEYDDPEYGNLSISHLARTRKYHGDSAIFSILRDGEYKVLTVNMESLLPDKYPIEPFVLDRAPDYMVVGGLVMQELSGEYLAQWGRNTPPARLSNYQRNQWDLIEPGEKVIILSQVLPATINIGYETLRFQIIDKVNGKDVPSLAAVAEALKTPPNGAHHIQLEGNHPRHVYLDAASLAAEDAQIQKRYGLPALQRLTPKP